MSRYRPRSARLKWGAPFASVKTSIAPTGIALKYVIDIFLTSLYPNLRLHAVTRYGNSAKHRDHHGERLTLNQPSCIAKSHWYPGSRFTVIFVNRKRLTKRLSPHRQVTPRFRPIYTSPRRSAESRKPCTTGYKMGSHISNLDRQRRIGVVFQIDEQTVFHLKSQHERNARNICQYWKPYSFGSLTTSYINTPSSFRNNLTR